MWYIHTMEYYSALKNVFICDNMDGPGRHYTKWNKPDTKGQICMFLKLLNIGVEIRMSI